MQFWSFALFRQVDSILQFLIERHPTIRNPPVLFVKN
jgi:hypothetical protein